MRRIILSLAVALSFALVAPAHAFVFGGEVFASFNTHTMEDWNDQIDLSNSSGSNFDNVTNGFTGGLGVRTWPSSNVMVAVTWEPFWLSTEDQGTELKLDANGFTGTVGYFFPATGNARYGLGAGLGYYTLAGESIAAGVSTDLEGSTVGFHFLGMGEWTVSPGFAVTGAAGYRIANISDTEADGQTIVPAIDTDYSGFTARAGLAFYLPSGY